MPELPSLPLGVIMKVYGNYNKIEYFFVANKIKDYIFDEQKERIVRIVTKSGREFDGFMTKDGNRLTALFPFQHKTYCEQTFQQEATEFYYRSVLNHARTNHNLS